MANFGDIPSNVVLAAEQSIRRNADNDAFEAYTPGGGSGSLWETEGLDEIKPQNNKLINAQHLVGTIDGGLFHP